MMTHSFSQYSSTLNIFKKQSSVPSISSTSYLIKLKFLLSILWYKQGKLFLCLTFAILGEKFAKSGKREIIEKGPAALLFTVINTNNTVHCDYVIRRSEDYTHLHDCDVSE